MMIMHINLGLLDKSFLNKVLENNVMLQHVLETVVRFFFFFRKKRRLDVSVLNTKLEWIKYIPVILCIFHYIHSILILLECYYNSFLFF